MFSQAVNEIGKKQVDDFWESAGENGALSAADRKDVLSYEQARELGLAPGENPAIPSPDEA
jgi:hypothetical protein